jgi:hypothetical protein
MASSMATYRNSSKVYTNPYRANCDRTIFSKINIGIAMIILVTCIAAGITVCCLTSIKQIITFL